MEKGKVKLTQKDAENTPAGGVVVGKRDGQTMIYDDASLGGYFVGKLHKDGGIKMVNKSTGQPLEVQGSEIIITAPAVADTTKREFEGKMMTNREILSKINSDGGGVSFADGGDIPAKIHTTDCEYKFGGKVVKDADIAHSLGMNSTLKKGKQQFSSGDTTYDVDAIYNAIKKGKLRLKTKEVETFPMKYPVYDKNYAENHKIDFRKPNGITVRTESGEEVLIDGNHRMNNAYSKGRKTMKTYYIEDPKQITKFTKKNKFELGGENKVGGHLSKGKSLKQIAEMHNVSLAHINEQLAKGLEVEKEHFADFKERTRVAKDHLVENPNYYTILAKAGLKDGGHLKSHHKQGESLVRDAKSGNTPARDLNNYNDLLDVQADGEVGGDSGIDMDGALVTGDTGAVNTFADGGEVGNEPKEGDLITNFGKYGVSIIDVDDKYVYWLDQYASKQHCKKSELSLNNLDDDGDDDGYYEGERNNWICNKVYADGGIAPYDANQEGDSASVLSTGGGVGLPKVAYVKVINAGSSLSNLIGNKYNSYIEFAESVEYAYNQLGKTVRSFVALEAFDENEVKLLSASSYVSNQKNTVKNFNPFTGNYKNLEKSLANSRPRSFQKFDWQDWLLSKVQPSIASASTNQTTSSTSTNKSVNNDVQSVLVTYAGGQTYTALNEQKLLDKIIELWKKGGRSTMSINLQPQGFVTALGEPTTIILDTIKTSKFSVQPSSVSLSELKGYLSEDWYSELDWSDFFKEASLNTKPLLTDLSKTKIQIIDPEMFKKVQERAFELGWYWTGDRGQKKQQTIVPKYVFFFNDKEITKANTLDVFEDSDFKEIFASDLFYDASPYQTTLSNEKDVVKTITAENGSNRGTFYDIYQLKAFLETVAEDNKDSLLKGSRSTMRFYLSINDIVQTDDFIINIGNDVSCSTCYDILTEGIERIKQIILAWDEDKKWDWSNFFDEPKKTASNYVVPKTTKQIVENLELAISKLEKASSTVVKEYNTDIYEKSLKFLYETKASYEWLLNSLLNQRLCMSD